jgi:hypothetical protein
MSAAEFAGQVIGVFVALWAVDLIKAWMRRRRNR